MSDCIHKIVKLSFSQKCNCLAAMCEQNCSRTQNHQHKHEIISTKKAQDDYKKRQKKLQEKAQLYLKQLDESYHEQQRKLKQKHQIFMDKIQKQLILNKSSNQRQGEVIKKVDNKRWDKMTCSDVYLLRNININPEINQQNLLQIISQYKLNSEGNSQNQLKKIKKQNQLMKQKLHQLQTQQEDKMNKIVQKQVDENNKLRKQLAQLKHLNNQLTKQNARLNAINHSIKIKQRLAANQEQENQSRSIQQISNPNKQEIVTPKNTVSFNQLLKRKLDPNLASVRTTDAQVLEKNNVVKNQNNKKPQKEKQDNLMIDQTVKQQYKESSEKVSLKFLSNEIIPSTNLSNKKQNVQGYFEKQSIKNTPQKKRIQIEQKNQIYLKPAKFTKTTKLQKFVYEPPKPSKGVEISNKLFENIEKLITLNQSPLTKPKFQENQMISEEKDNIGSNGEGNSIEAQSKKLTFMEIFGDIFKKKIQNKQKQKGENKQRTIGGQQSSEQEL